MLAELTEKIEVTRTASVRKSVLERQLSSTENALATAKEKVEQLQIAYKKEARDVEKMNSMSFSNFVSTLLNNKAERLEQEELEALEAKRKLDSSNFDVVALETEYLSIQKQLAPLKTSEADYQIALQEKRTYLKAHQIAGHTEIEGFETALNQLTQQQIEIAEAIDAANQTLNHLSTVVGVLSEAKSWSTYDMVGGGMFATMVKRDKMDQAKGLMDGLNQKIERLNRELSDIEALNVANMDLDGFRISDYLFDSFFVDFAVHQRIVDAIDKHEQLNHKLTRLSEQLSGNLEKVNQSIVSQQQRLAEHVYSI